MYQAVHGSPENGYIIAKGLFYSSESEWKKNYMQQIRWNLETKHTMKKASHRRLHKYVG